MIPPIRGFVDEFDFFEKALADPAILTAYRSWIEYVAAEEVDRLIADGASLDRHCLLEAAMIPFERAFAFHGKREASSPQDYPFSAYYRWWARQFATARLHNS